MSYPSDSYMRRLNPAFTAHSLIWAFHDFASMVANRDDWSAEALTPNPPRFYRFQQTTALCHAFDVESIQELESGDFLERRWEQDRDLYLPFGQEIARDLLREGRGSDLLRRAGEDLASGREPDSELLGKLARQFRPTEYQHLFRRNNAFLGTLHATRVFDSGVLAASDVHLYGLQQRREIRKGMAPSLREAAHNVAKWVDPTGREVQWTSLVAEYDYPDVDLRKVDLDWV